MMVFGDTAHRRDPRAFLAEIRQTIDRPGEADRWIDTHAEAVRCFIDIAELAQGIADATFAHGGIERPTPPVTAATELLMAAAYRVRTSWEGTAPGSAAPAVAAIDRLAACDLPARIVCRRAEGYAFYALYPETYIEAGRALRGIGAVRFIGIRSIGFGLAALAAAGADAAPPLSVRPTGHPFSRVLAGPPAAAEALSRSPDAVAVVDEGPGLSGSSFGAVLSALETAGIARRKLHVLPSHGGALGPLARPVDRERWPLVQKHITSFEALFIDDRQAGKGLPTWVEDLVGAPAAPLRDIGGGQWRRLRYETEACWPAAHVQQERRKYLLHSESGTWLLKFNGLDRGSQRKAALAAALGKAGFTPVPQAVRHGFLVEPWLGDARPLDLRTLPRGRFVDRLGAYLAFRARHFATEESAGASLVQLSEVLVHNATAALGDTLSDDLRRFCGRSLAASPPLRRVATDNRLHLPEWLLRPDGTIVKTDAVDHAATHDLVGAQDITWDIAGAIVELGLSDDEVRAIGRRIEASTGKALDVGLLCFLLPCYIAFHHGAAWMACQALHSLPREADRFRKITVSYRTRLAEILKITL